jgi:DNA-binding transcriptional regulator LsrR (DeoR family)
MRRLKDKISPDKLEQLYLVDRLSTTQIAERLGTNRESVRRLIKKYGIAMREPGYPFDKRQS